MANVWKIMFPSTLFFLRQKAGPLQKKCANGSTPGTKKISFEKLGLSKVVICTRMDLSLHYFRACHSTLGTKVWKGLGFLMITLRIPNQRAPNHRFTISSPWNIRKQVNYHYSKPANLWFLKPPKTSHGKCNFSRNFSGATTGDVRDFSKHVGPPSSKLPIRLVWD